MVNAFAETEKQMVSVERAVQYIEDVPSEAGGHGSVSLICIPSIYLALLPFPF